MTWARELWGVTLVLSCTIGVASAGGCSGDIGPVRDEGDASAGSSGASGSGGSGGSTGGAAGRGGASGTTGSGGTAAGSAGRATGGASGAGGSTGGSIPPGCGPRSDESRCFQCARTNCCVELNACGQEPVCSSGVDEFGCILRCVRNRVADGGVADDMAIGQCATACADNGVNAAEPTSDLIGCLNKGVRVDGGSGADCYVECFAGD